MGGRPTKTDSMKVMSKFRLCWTKSIVSIKRTWTTPSSKTSSPRLVEFFREQAPSHARLMVQQEGRLRRHRGICRQQGHEARTMLQWRRLYGPQSTGTSPVLSSDGSPRWLRINRRFSRGWLNISTTCSTDLHPLVTQSWLSFRRLKSTHYCGRSSPSDYWSVGLSVPLRFWSSWNSWKIGA